MFAVAILVLLAACANAIGQDVVELTPSLFYAFLAYLTGINLRKGRNV
jgi:hypothetical protein